mmetsp:Transcript_18664/g.48639  ORF Transcript_18664/g.48639 Transcript_18664/m.48639 type:complete len:232 (+) Transcript_18664:240-935(+)
MQHRVQGVRRWTGRPRRHQPQQSGPMQQRDAGHGEQPSPPHLQSQLHRRLRGDRSRLDPVQPVAGPGECPRVRPVRPGRRGPSTDRWEGRVRRHGVRLLRAAGVDAAADAIRSGVACGLCRRDDVGREGQPRRWVPVPAVPARIQPDGRVFPTDPDGVCRRLAHDDVERLDAPAGVDVCVGRYASGGLDVADAAHPDDPRRARPASDGVPVRPTVHRPDAAEGLGAGDLLG